MIIDTTVSTMEVRMDKLRKLNTRKDDPNRSKKWRKMAVRDFLLENGQDPGENFNYIAYWENGELVDAQFICKTVKVKSEERKLEERFQKLIDKFENFMQFGMRNIRNSLKLSK